MEERPFVGDFLSDKLLFKTKSSSEEFEKSFMWTQFENVNMMRALSD
jgi:hypothetical protein